MFQPRDKLRFRLEAARKFWLIGVDGQNDLDRDFTADRRLERPVDRAKCPCADLLAQFVPFKKLSNIQDS
jgi:hypothetical protein